VARIETMQKFGVIDKPDVHFLDGRAVRVHPTSGRKKARRSGLRTLESKRKA
jgi:hypothetical protein